MSVIGLDRLPAESAGLRLCKVQGDDLRLCERVMFRDGKGAVATVLLRAALSGSVEVEPAGELPDYFADVMDREGSMIANVSLDQDSFRALKSHWMRCRYEDTTP